MSRGEYKVLLAGARVREIQRESMKQRGVEDPAVYDNRYKVVIASRIGNLAREGESGLRGTKGREAA